MSYAKEYYKKYYQINKEKIKEKCANYQKLHPEYRKNYRKTHPNYQKERKQKLKLKVLEKLGGKCSNPNCPIPKDKMDIRCLQIDHVNGGGHKEYLSLKTGKPTTFYLKVLADMEGNYQLLCAYCNWLKRYINKQKGCC